MAGKSKRAVRIKQASEYLPNLLALSQALRPPKDATSGAYAWTLEDIRSARDAQLRGKFRLPAMLASSMSTDDAIYTARRNRIAPVLGIPTALVPARGARGERIAAEAEGLFGPDGVGLSLKTIADVALCLADHGVAFTHNVLTPRADGSRVDLETRCWPIEHVEWDVNEGCYYTRTDGHSRERICHGDGRWGICSAHDIRPYVHGAIVPAALLWADRAYGVRDRSRASTSHGNAKMIGELPEGIAIDSPEGAALLLLLRTMHEALPYGIRPHGSKTEMLVNTSTSWQIFDSIISNRLKDAARIYLGHDGSVSASGSNYVKDGFLFGVSTSIVEADLRALERCIYEAGIVPWTALNFGDSSASPTLKWQMPDGDVAQKRDDLAAATKAYLEAVDGYRKSGFVIDQAVADKMAKTYGVEPLVLAQSDTTPVARLDLAPTDIARVVRVDEARRSQGLPPISDQRGGYMISEVEAKSAIPSDPAAGAPASTPASPQAAPASAAPALRAVPAGLPR